MKNSYVKHAGGATYHELLPLADWGPSGTPGALNNVAVRFEDVIFDCEAEQSVPLFDIREDECDIEFVNCKLTANAVAAGLYVDNRTDKVTYDITETNTTTWTASEPTYENWDYTDEDNHGKLTHETYHALGMGFRTPGGVTS